ncbi:MAG: isochorismate synthase, partial [Bacteroidales bacterium]|nr:isochorismate synthase [Bacteroidales bacterium]
LFHEALSSGYCEKIVLSRPYRFSKPIGFSAGKTFQAACKAYPEAFVYLFHSLKTGTWLGSSPELILSGKGENWQTVAMAGTKKISKGNETPEWDEKNIKEQHIVADYIKKQLYAHHLTCTIKGPFACRAGRLMHLKTAFFFRMIDNSKIGDLLDILHPTPAVCGYPKKEAYRLITEEEGYDRSYYSGFIGKLSLSEKTGLFVNLRCMQIGAKLLTLFAGGGLLTSSELEPEWEETEAKLQTMLSLMEK